MANSSKRVRQSKGLHQAVRTKEEKRTDAFVDAVEKNWTEFVLKYLAEGQDINAYDRFGATALLTAIRRSNAAMVQLLLDNGGDAHWVDDEGWTLLHEAALAGNVEVLMLLKEYGGADDTLRTTDGYRPLDIAVRYGKVDVLDYLAKGFDPDQGYL